MTRLEGFDGRSFALDHQCPAVGSAETDLGSPEDGTADPGRCRQPGGCPEYRPEGNPDGELADPEQAREILRVPNRKTNRANGITSCWDCWSAAPSAGRNLHP